MRTIKERMARKEGMRRTEGMGIREGIVSREEREDRGSEAGFRMVRPVKPQRHDRLVSLS